jgi:uncharacterized membrane protein (GlpM family)
MEYFGLGIYKILMLLPQLLIMAACIYYVANKQSADGVLMTIGQALIVVSSFVLYFISFFSMYSIMHRLSFVGAVLFGIGLFMLVVNTAKK